MPDGELGARRVLLARGRRRRRARRRRRRARDGRATSTASARTRCSVVDGGPYGAVRPARRSARSSGSSRRGAARSSSTPRRSTCDRRRRGDRPRPPEGAARAGPRTRRPRAAGRTPAPASRGRPRRRADRRQPRRRAMTLEIDVLTLFPAMFDGPLADEHPGPDPGAGPGRDPGPRPARVGPRPAPLASTTRRTAAARGWSCGRSRSRAALDALRRPDSTRHPARPGRRGLPPGARRRPRDAVAPRSSSARATRASTSGSARSSTSSCRSATTSLTGGELPALVVIDARHPAAARARSTTPRPTRSRSARRPARVPAVHAPADVPRHGRPGDPRRRATTARSRRWRRRGRPMRRTRDAPSGPARRPDARATGRARSTTRPERACYTPPPVAPSAAISDRPSRSHGCPRRSRNRRVNVLDEIVQDQLRTDLPGARHG